MDSYEKSLQTLELPAVLALLAAWLAVSLWHILHHRGCGCGGCSGDCAHCRTSCGKEDR